MGEVADYPESSNFLVVSEFSESNPRVWLGYDSCFVLDDHDALGFFPEVLLNHLSSHVVSCRDEHVGVFHHFSVAMAATNSGATFVFGRPAVVVCVRVVRTR